MNRTTRFVLLSTLGLSAALTSIAAAQAPAPPAPRALLEATFHGGGARQEPTAAAPAAAAPQAGESERSRVQAVRAELLAAADGGEMARADAERVAADLAGYISGERTFPESA
ncbi:hypothetical protein GSY69_07925 [Brevibacterium sp. 5221]|uniref:Uncharacterized protein n=1 Tax=Brevibacterium rongguiense TaxID=2695267 RepID=A0A6N9H7L2_9MICO|nr:hypothetical protein [Brevibacterium rongguiense]MYM19895.1 hypothetical protein [Brevibacterium rongguiense]